MRDVSAGRDVDQIILIVGIEGKAAREVEQLAIYLFEIPGVVEVEQLRHDLGFGRHVTNVVGDIFSEPAVITAVQQNEAIDAQILLHADADRWPPLVPARRPELGGIERRAEESDDGNGLHGRFYMTG